MKPRSRKGRSWANVGLGLMPAELIQPVELDEFSDAARLLHSPDFQEMADAGDFVLHPDETPDCDVK